MGFNEKELEAIVEDGVDDVRIISIAPDDVAAIYKESGDTYKEIKDQE